MQIMQENDHSVFSEFEMFIVITIVLGILLGKSATLTFIKNKTVKLFGSISSNG